MVEVWYNWRKEVMRYMRLVFLLVFLFCSNTTIAQDFKINFKNAAIYVYDLRQNLNTKLFIRTEETKFYELLEGKLYKHEVKKLENKYKIRFGFIDDFLIYLMSSLHRPHNKSVVRNESNTYKIESTPKEIKSSNLDAESIDLYVDSIRIASKRDTIDTYNISSLRSAIVDLVLDDSKMTTLKIESSVLSGSLLHSMIDSLVLYKVEFRQKFVLFSSPLPGYISLNKILCKNERGPFDLTEFQITDSTRVCDLNLGIGVASQIKANYKYFNLVFDHYTSLYDKEQVYTELLNMQRANYFLDGYERLDKEYKAFKYHSRGSFVAKLQNWIDKYWWDYGYDKFKVIQNSVILFLLFFCINLLAYKGLAKVYHPIKFKEFDERLEMSNVEIKHPIATRVKKYLIRIPVIFLYTAFVFWGLKLDLKELEIKKPFFMSILIVQYVIGLICLAYIANYIISK